MGLLRYAIAASLGFAAHFSNPIFETMEATGTPPAWVRMARYVTGVITLIPAWLVLLNGDRRNRRLVDAYLTAATLYGVGVACGYLLDELHERRGS